MSVSGTAPVFWKAVGLSRPGTRVTMLSPGLKPSLRLMSAGSMWVPARFVGVEASPMIDPQPGRGPRVGDRVVVAREREQAVGAGAGDRLAPVRALQDVALRRRTARAGVLERPRTLRLRPLAASRGDGQGARRAALEHVPAGDAQRERDGSYGRGGASASARPDPGHPERTRPRAPPSVAVDERSYDRKHARAEHPCVALRALEVDGHRLVVLRGGAGGQRQERGAAAAPIASLNGSPCRPVLRPSSKIPLSIPSQDLPGPAGEAISGRGPRLSSR